ncbi:TonB-dependent receptor [Flavobacteriaceae bacterium 3-367]
MKRFFILFILLFSLGLGAQENTRHKNVSLSTVLTELEALYDVKFSYNAGTIGGRRISLDLRTVSLQGALSRIEKDLNVVFEQVDERYYTLKNLELKTICGYLKDATAGHPVEGATIMNASKGTGTVSDEFGFFRLTNNGPSDTLYISFLGYRTLELPMAKIKEDKCDTYTMSSEGYVLNEVVVREYLAEGIVKTQDGSIKINPQNLDILSGLVEPDVLQHVQLLPGVESPSETVSGLYIRGGSPDQNLILWDGIKMYNSDHFFGMISAFNPYITKDIRIYRSGVKPQYGDRVSGVVDIRTTNNVPSRIQGGLGANMTHADAYLEIPVSKDLGLLISGRRSITDIINTPAFNNFSSKVFQNTSITENQQIFQPEFSQNREDFYFADVTLKLIAQLSQKDKLTVSNLFTTNKLDYSFSDMDFQIDSSDRLNIRNLGTNTTWSRDWSDKFSSRAQFYYSEYDFDYNGENGFYDDDFSVSKENNIKEIGANLRTDWTLNKTVSFTNGYQFFSNQVRYLLADRGFTESDNQNSPTHAIYSQLNYNKSSAWYVDLGLRANYYTALNSTFVEPRIYAERIFGEHFRLKGSAEIRNQAISQIIEFATLDFGLENQVWALAGEDGLPLLRSDQLSFGFQFSKNGWNVDVDAYYKNIDGFTSFTRGFESTENVFAEGSSATTGVDLLLKKKINKYATWLGYTYSTTDFTFENLNAGEPFKGNNNITHSLTWSHSYKWNNFQFSLGWRYRTGIPYTRALGISGENENASIEYAALNADNLSDYHRMDFSTMYEFNLSKNDSPIIGKLGFSVLNLYDRKNELSRNYALFEVFDDQNNSTVELREISKFSLNLTTNLVFRLSF